MCVINEEINYIFLLLITEVNLKASLRVICYAHEIFLRLSFFLVDVNLKK